MAKKKNHDHLFDDEQNSSSADFASLLRASESGFTETLRVGDRLIGELISIGKEEAFVSLSKMNRDGSRDGALPLSELKSDDGQFKYKVGDRIEVQVVRLKQGEILLKRAGSTQANEDVENLEDAFDLELPVEGRVSEVVKGGYRVQIMGKTAFCPISQIDLRVSSEPEAYLNQKFEFIITQFENAGRNIVVSRRRVLELKRAESEGEFLLTAKPGDIFSGRITRIERYGAFVKLNNQMEGLIPVSELAWGRVQNPAEIVHIGQEVQVALLQAIEEGDRLKISFSLKQAGGEGDPWISTTEKFPVGSIVEGVIERKETYGLFVSLRPGVTGLMPRSKWRDRIDASSFENRKKGEKLVVQVDEISVEDKRITLAPPDEMRDESWRQHASARSGVTGTKGLGTMADLFKDLKLDAPKGTSGKRS